MNTLNRSCMYKVEVIDCMLNPTDINSSNTEQGDLIINSQQRGRRKMSTNGLSQTELQVTCTC